MYMYILIVYSLIMLTVFFLQKDSFSMYSEYCNNHPHAVNEMNLLQQDQQYVLFFEVNNNNKLLSLYMYTYSYYMYTCTCTCT